MEDWVGPIFSNILKCYFSAVKFLPSLNPAKSRQEAIHYAKNFKVGHIFFISTSAHLENPQVLKDLLKQNVPIVAPFLKTYETFGHVRRICDIGLEHPLNDSSAFPDIIAQKGLREQNYEIIKVSIRIRMPNHLLVISSFHLLQCKINELL